MTTRSLDNRGETEALACAEDSPLGPPSGRSAVILTFPTRSSAAASEGWGEDEADDCFEQVGLVAVRMMARWSLPFIHCEVQSPGTQGEE